MTASDSKSPAILAEVMQRDRFRLQKAWQRLHRRRAPTEQEVQDWHRGAQASVERRQSRQRDIPAVSYDSDLPIAAHASDIVELLRTRQAIVVCGETGSGKSTQLPKMCLEAGLGVAGMIGHTQPRRLAARAIANRLSEELATSVGDKVGFKIRFADSTSPDTLIKLMTDGVLLAETQSDRFLDQYDAIIIDEAHERSLNIDFLIGYLRNISRRRPDLRLIITSATIDPERFAEHFSDEHGPAPIVEVSGRGYPVEIGYRPIAGDSGEIEDEVQARAIADAVDELETYGSGDILTFLPTERDIRVVAKYLRGHLTRRGKQDAVEILPLYARLSQAEQNKIFASHARRRIVLATNVAESSLTVPGVHFVIDTGLVRISRYAPRSKVQRLPIENISQASANQRSGRCGRLGPGVCIRLYAEDDFQSRPKFTTPELRRSDLASVLLQSLFLRLGPLEEFPLLDPPTAESLRDAQRTLRELGAIDESGKLTQVGTQLGGLPCEPRVGRMLLEARERDCLAEVVVIAAALECQDVRQRPAGKRAAADEAHAQFLDPHSDFLSYLRLWDFYHKLRNDLSRSRLNKALGSNFLSHQGLREWADVARQLRDLLGAAGIRVGKRKLELESVPSEVFEKPQRGSRRQDKDDAETVQKIKRPAGYAGIHQSLLSGLLSGIARRGDQYDYQAARGLEVALWPGSGLFRRQPKWIMTAEIVETSRRYARTVAEIDVEWIEKAAEPLLKHSYSDPHWSRKTASAMVYRRSTLYGLPIVTGRREQLAPLDPETARSLLIENGLVGGDWKCQEKFYLHNQELQADIHELVQRTRSSDFILDRFHLSNFYNERLPAEVVDLQTLKSWLRKNQGKPREQALWMQPNDLLETKEATPPIEELYPNEFQLAESSFPLEYQFEPGNERDGVTITIPQVALRQVSEPMLAWLVPGLLEEKILHLIRSLPKNLRTNFVPAPDVANRLAQELGAAQGTQGTRDRSFPEQLCLAMSQHAGEKIKPSDFDQNRLPSHLKFVIRVIDDEGNILEEDRDLSKLQAEYATASTHLTESAPEVQDWTNLPVTPQDFDTIPDQVGIRRGGLTITAFPTLVDLGDRVEIRLADTEGQAERTSRGGFTRLLAMQHNRSLRSQVSHLPHLDAHAVKLAHLIPPKELRPQLQDLILRIALLEEKELPRDRLALEARNVVASVQISIAAQAIATWLPKFAGTLHDLRLRMEKAPASWQEVFDDIQRQMDHLLTPDFLRVTPWSALQEYPRYGQAILMRLQKLTSGGLPKDRKLRAPIEGATNAYTDLYNRLAEPDLDERLQRLRWMIEEFRVSVFAQQLGTKQSVSEKRLQELIGQIEQSE